MTACQSVAFKFFELPIPFGQVIDTPLRMSHNEHYLKFFQEFLAQFKNVEDCWNYILKLDCQMSIYV